MCGLMSEAQFRKFVDSLQEDLKELTAEQLRIVEGCIHAMGSYKYQGSPQRSARCFLVEKSPGGIVATFQSLKQAMDASAMGLSRHQIEALVTVLHGAYYQKYRPKRRVPRYGTLSKGLSTEELQRLLLAVKDPRFKLMFTMAAYLGLRIGEAVCVNAADIDFKEHSIVVHTEKSRVTDVLPFPPFLFGLVSDYMAAHRYRIEAHEGYLFYKETKFANRKSNVPHVDSGYTRRVFRDACDKASLRYAYAFSDETKGRTPRHLHKTTFQSLRHYGITNFNRLARGDMRLTQMFARHIDSSSTARYVHRDRIEVDRIVRTMKHVQRQAKLGATLIKESLPLSE